MPSLACPPSPPDRPKIPEDAEPVIAGLGELPAKALSRRLVPVDVPVAIDLFDTRNRVEEQHREQLESFDGVVEMNQRVTIYHNDIFLWPARLHVLPAGDVGVPEVPPFLNQLDEPLRKCAQVVDIDPRVEFEANGSIIVLHTSDPTLMATNQS